MSDFFKIKKQTEAEKDDYLIECFHDSGFIGDLIESKYSVISGRKGAGKTAIAKYLESKPSDFGLDFVTRVSVKNISFSSGENHHARIDSILFFIIVKFIQKALIEKIWDNGEKKYWEDFLVQNGLQNILDYQSFIVASIQNKVGFNLGASFKSFIASGEVKTGAETLDQALKNKISNSPSSLIDALVRGLPIGKKYFLFIDDISDYLDYSEVESVERDIDLVRDILTKLDLYNSLFADAKIDFRFISIVREDLFEFMKGSNINKIRNDSLVLKWDEKSFASLLIKRLPLLRVKIEENLKDPIGAIKKQFPDEIFTSRLSNFGTNQYQSKFYAYMVAVSFNRPRDFLMFAYSMRDRLSQKLPASESNIEASEIEYSDYFTKELKDELYICSKILDINLNQEKMDELVDILSKSDVLNSSQLRDEISKYLDVKTKIGKNKIENFISELWWYGIIGFKKDKNTLISFKYFMSYIPMRIEEIKKYSFYLHRGLWWFAKKRKK